MENKKDGSYSLIGQTGLERSLNSLLTGTDGEAIYEKDKDGNTLLGTETITKEAIDGKNIYTTLSAPLQTFLETQMDTFMEQTKGVNASATVVNAKTGEILATTQRPTYNSDTLEGQAKKGYDWVNRLYEAQYEPGSTMKVMLLSAAINNGSFNPNATYSNANGIKVGDVEINDWSINEGISTGRTMSFAQGFSYSSNVGMTMLEQAMGDKVWSNYLSLYKFGIPTRFGMVGESSGIVSRNSVNIAQSSFGQGISVTQVQMLRAFTAISNNGIMLEPQFIKQVADTNKGTVRTAKKEVIGKPVSKQAASETRNYMISVGTDPEFGTLYNKSEGSPIIQVGNNDVAVKSGTAQVPDEKTGTYKVGTNETLNSVVAMVPSEDPEYIMYVTVQEPKTWNNNFFATVVNPVLEEDGGSFSGTPPSPSKISVNGSVSLQAFIFSERPMPNLLTAPSPPSYPRPEGSLVSSAGPYTPLECSQWQFQRGCLDTQGSFRNNARTCRYTQVPLRILPSYDGSDEAAHC